jgi:ABC-type uncharacterized transport system substrate-binding protein
MTGLPFVDEVSQVIGRRAFVTVVAGTCLLEPIAVRAQQAAKVVTIGLLVPATEPTPGTRIALEDLRMGLRDLGWVVGKNLSIEIRWAGVDPQRQRELAAELKALPVALILAPGTITIGAAREGAPGVPVVMINAGDPVGAGFVATLARPGGDLTGTSAAGEEVLAKQLELLSDAVPQLKRVSVLMNSANPANGFFFDAMSLRAKTLGLRLDRIDVAVEGELNGAVARAQGGALVVNGDPMFFRHRVHIIELTLRSRVPSVFGGREYVAAGGLMSYLSSNAWHWRSAASFVDKILRGAKPGDIPVEQPTKFDLVINLKTARALGITIPQAVLLRADEVIQ